MEAYFARKLDFGGTVPLVDAALSKMVPIERTASCQLLPFISGGRTYLRQTVDRKKP